MHTASLSPVLPTTVHSSLDETRGRAMSFIACASLADGRTQTLLLVTDRVFDSAQRASAPLAALRVSRLADGAMAHREGETVVMKAANRRSMRCVGVLLVSPQRISGEA